MVLIVNFPPKLPHVGLYEKLETFTTDHKATSCERGTYASLLTATLVQKFQYTKRPKTTFIK